jgi:hypothetical protein
MVTGPHQGWLHAKNPVTDDYLKTCSTSIFSNDGQIPPYVDIPVSEPEQLAMM